MKTSITGGALIAAVLGLAACGGGTSESGTVTAEPAVRDTTDAVRDTVAYQPRSDTSFNAQPQDTAMPRRQQDMPAQQVPAQETPAEDEDYAATPRTFTFDAMNNADASGQVALSQAGAGETRIAITLTGGAAAGQAYAGVYRGTCDDPGTIVEPLQNVGADGRSTTTLQLPIAQLLAGDHVVLVRGDAAGQSEPIACATLAGAETQHEGMDHQQH